MKTFISIYIKNHPIVRKIKMYLFPKRYIMSNYNLNARRVTTVIANCLPKTTNIRSLQITDVKVEIKKQVHITITLARPGLLIGEAGKTIDDITAILSDYYSRTVIIHIKESHIFL
jgi:ribosomal protein S3